MLCRHFFSAEKAGREVLLYTNESVIRDLGKTQYAGVPEFVEAVKTGPPWETRSGLCQKGPSGLRGLAVQDGPRVDVMFLLDATGSMRDKIQAVKDRIREMIFDIALGEPAPDVRFGIAAYRDRGDEFVTRTYPLTRNIDLIVENLDEIEATGGGDYPESLNEGLHTAVQEIEWDATGNVARLVFLIADARLRNRVQLWWCVASGGSRPSFSSSLPAWYS